MPLTKNTTTAKKGPEEVKKTSKKDKIPKLLRGFKDILPEQQRYWLYIRDVAESFARGYGFNKIDTPVLEESSLFVRSVGKQTDIVQKEMFTFADKSEGSVTLRPEGTASIARSYINHGMLSLPQPVKLFYWGPFFRRERPQSGRYRQFHQFGFEVIGDDNPIIDAQLITIAYNLYRQIGLKDISIQVNSLGTPECRKEYLEELTSYFKSKRRMLSDEAKKLLTRSPLRLLDSKDPSLEPLKAEAPQIIDWLDEESKTHFMKVIEYLDELDIPYVLNPYLVRGLDYYTKTVFEVWPGEEKEGAQSALCGGGRYDNLIETLDGRPTPAAGFAPGIERIILQMKALEIQPPARFKPQIFLAQIGDQAKIKAMALFEQLRQENVPVAENLAKDSLKAQLELANKQGVKYVMILGQKEVIDGTILIRDMESGVQEVVDFNKAVGEIKKKVATE